MWASTSVFVGLESIDLVSSFSYVLVCLGGLVYGLRRWFRGYVMWDDFICGLINRGEQTYVVFQNHIRKPPLKI